MTSPTDFSTLGRLGTASGRAPKRRRPRAVRRSGLGAQVAGVGPLQLAIAAVLVVLAVLFGLGLVLDAQTGPMPGVTRSALTLDPALEAALRTGDATSISTGTMTLTPGGGAAAGSVEAPPTFAAVDDLALHMPTGTGQEIVFLEADTPAALPLVPVGVMAHNGNPEGFEPTADFDGPQFRVAPPMSGVRPATGMAALLTAPGGPLLAPVQGVVTSVVEYTDVDGTADHKVAIQPDGRTDLQVVVRRITDPAVAVGQEVTVGVTQIGTVRSGRVIGGEQNPLSLPAALLHVRPATDAEVDLRAPTEG